MRLKLRFGPVNIFGLVGALLLLIGLAGPWLSMYYERHTAWDPVGLRVIWSYNRTIDFNPLFAVFTRHGKVLEGSWFYSVGATMAGGGFFLAALLSALDFRRWEFSMLGFFLWLSSFMIFIMSFGRLDWGYGVLGNWGLHLGLYGGVIIFASSITTMLSDS